MNGLRLFLGIISASMLVSCTQPSTNDISEQTSEVTEGVYIEEKSSEKGTDEQLAKSTTVVQYEYVFPDEKIASAEVIQEIKDRIASINFTIQEFPINKELYDSESDIAYKQAFFEAITNQVPLTDINYPDSETYYKQLLRGEDLPQMSVEGFLEILKKCKYHYIDFDGDGLPELVIHLDGPAILKYVPEESQVYLLGKYSTKSGLLGSSQMYFYDPTGANRQYYSYWAMDMEGNENSFSFDQESTLRNDKWCYDYCLISIDEFEQVNVGKENWDEITKDFLEIVAQSDELALPYSTFTEIFGTITLD